MQATSKVAVSSPAKRPSLPQSDSSPKPRPSVAFEIKALDSSASLQLSAFDRGMTLLQEHTRQKKYSKSMTRRLRRILKEENSFLFGMAETLANNFDLIFRYLFAAAFLLLMAAQFLNQNTSVKGYAFVGAAIVITIMFMIALAIVVLLYRQRFTNIDAKKAALFYLKCKCFKTK